MPLKRATCTPKSGTSKTGVRTPVFVHRNTAWSCRLLTLFDVAQDVAHRLKLFRVFVRNFDPELFLECHHELDGVQGISAQILHKLRFRSHLPRVDTKLLNDDVFDLFLDVVSHINDSSKFRVAILGHQSFGKLNFPSP